MAPPPTDACVVGLEVASASPPSAASAAPSSPASASAAVALMTSLRKKKGGREEGQTPPLPRQKADQEEYPRYQPVYIQVLEGSPPPVPSTVTQTAPARYDSPPPPPPPPLPPLSCLQI